MQVSTTSSFLISPSSRRCFSSSSCSQLSRTQLQKLKPGPLLGLPDNSGSSTARLCLCHPHFGKTHVWQEKVFFITHYLVFKKNLTVWCSAPKVNVLLPASLWRLSHIPPASAFNFHQLQSCTFSHRKVGEKTFKFLAAFFMLQICGSHNNLADFKLQVRCQLLLHNTQPLLSWALPHCCSWGWHGIHRCCVQVLVNHHPAIIFLIPILSPSYPD